MYHNLVLSVVIILLVLFYVMGLKNKEKLANLGTAHPNVLSNPAPNPFGSDKRLGLDWENRYMHL